MDLFLCATVRRRGAAGAQNIGDRSAILPRALLSRPGAAFKGRLADAIPEFQKAFDLNGDPYSLGMLGQAYARNGQKDEAQKVLLRLNEEAKSRYVAPYAITLVYLGLGEKERALDKLERA